MTKLPSIYVAGHQGLIGSAVLRLAIEYGHYRVITATRQELDLTDKHAVDNFFDTHTPDYVVVAAGKVGGIRENQANPAHFLTTNLSIQLNVLSAAFRKGARKTLFFGSSCMYPRDAHQPMSEAALLSGIPEPTSLPYAIAKLAGLQMCLAYNQQIGEQRFLPVIPNSVYGPNDDFNFESAHVLSALIHRLHLAVSSKAKSLTLWGTGSPRREFIHADDVAAACLMLLESDTARIDLPLNLGVGHDCSIQELAEKIARVVGFNGTIEWDPTKPDGAPRKLLDSSRMYNFGWRPVVNFNDGLHSTYRWFLENHLKEVVV
jgi:GDP-L-fucose synthase